VEIEASFIAESQASEANPWLLSLALSEHKKCTNPLADSMVLKADMPASTALTSQSGFISI
jgi:hypothetical protein